MERKVPHDSEVLSKRRLANLNFDTEEAYSIFDFSVIEVFYIRKFTIRSAPNIASSVAPPTTVWQAS